MQVKDIEVEINNLLKNSHKKSNDILIINIINMSQSLGFVDILPMFVVSLFWGGTNPFIEKYTHIDEKEFDATDFSASSLFKILKRWKFLMFYGINQIGSLLYGYLLGVYPEQFSLISANALTVVVTFVTESILKKKPLKIKQVSGVLLIIGGIYFIV